MRIQNCLAGIGLYVLSLVGAGAGEKQTVQTTAYTHTEKGGPRNAIGTKLKYTRKHTSAAADWSWLPLGTHLKFVGDDRVYVIEDYGSALVGRKVVDLYMPSRSAMNRYGRRNRQMTILKMGSYARSLKILKGRTRRGYIRRMVAALRKRQGS